MKQRLNLKYSEPKCIIKYRIQIGLAVSENSVYKMWTAKMKNTIHDRVHKTPYNSFLICMASVYRRRSVTI